MTSTTSEPRGLDELFRRWEHLLTDGRLTTASFVAADRPEHIPALQRLINGCLSDRAAALAATAADGAAAPGDRWAPPHIPGYTFLERLGGGGMGDVWRVTDPLDQERALKTIRVDRLSAVGRERFLAEAKAMKRVEHSFIAPVHQFHWHGATPFFLMDVYPASLEKRLAEYQADPVKAVRLMAAVAEAVGSMHAKGYIHRDLKPANVLLTADGTPKVSDLGLAKLLAEVPSAVEPGGGAADPADTRPAAAARTVAGTVMGTRPYMAPAQAAGLVHLVNPTWDVFALGVMLHELLAGRLPPSSDAPAELLNPDRPPDPPPSAFNPRLDPYLERVIQTCLAPNEADRYPDGAAVAAALRGWPRLRAPRRRARLIRLTWAFLLMGVVGLGVGLGSLAFEGDPGGSDAIPADAETPAAALARVQADFRAGRRVVVIPETGFPVWSDIAVGRDHVKPYLADDDGAFVIDSGRTILMDLPPTGGEPFRFEVRARQLVNVGDNIRFGIHAGRHRLPSPTGQVEAYLALRFNDQAGEKPRSGLRTAAAWSHQAVPGAGAVDGGVEFGTVAYAPPRAKEYHTLAVEVRPTGATFFWDDRPLDRIPFPFAHDVDFAAAARLAPGTATAFGPDGGYGLVVFGGACAFKNGTIQRLPNP